MNQPIIILGNMKNMATDIGNEIDTQNKRLYRINDEVILFYL